MTKIWIDHPAPAAPKSPAPAAAKKSTDRFSQVYKKTEAHGKAPGDDKAKGEAQAKKLSKDGSPASSTSLPLRNGGENSSTPPTPQEAQRSSKSGGSASSSQIHSLASEMSHHIEVFKQDGLTKGVNLTFDSKTLEGLQVQIRQQDGKMTIRFVTQSDSIAKLLSRHTDGLRDGLTSKGVSISNIAIARGGTGGSAQGNVYAGI
jgi:flagellar hook-length control protein FliK